MSINHKSKNSKRRPIMAVKEDKLNPFLNLTKAERSAEIQDVRRTPKIDRNSKCICGSGLKYKNCCGQ